MNELVHNQEQNAVYRKRAEELVQQMTLKEKISQMLNDSPAIPRLNIPAYNWWNEGLHGVARGGVATVFPQAIAMAAAFDEDLMEQVGDAIATEGRAKYNLHRSCEDRDIYKGLTFWAPNINIFRDPRWGRGHETLGEDPYLTGLLGKRFVQGLQGHDPKYLKTAACAKHFAVHSGPEDVRHSFNAEASRQDMAETYLPAFRTLVKDAGVEAVMGAYNRTNGEPCCGSKTLLKDILREKWGFAGHVTSDCWAIKDFHEGHMVTNGPAESVALAVNNGCDLNCGNLFVYLEQAAACAKHFAVHSGPEDVRHSFNAEASRQDMAETYLPAFRTLVKDAGVEAVMGAYNRTNGEPCCGSKTLLKDILREKWGFAGHVTSDCWAIKDFHEGHMVTNGPAESVALAVNNGCDLNCGNLFVYLEQAAEEGLVTEEAITEAVVRLFTTRMKLGMFDPEEDVPFNAIGYEQVDSPAMRALNLSAAEKTLVLLKNQNNILPLDKKKLKCVGVIGPNADNRKSLVGNYEGTSSRYVTVLEGIQDYLGDDVRVMYSQGCHLYEDRFQQLAHPDDRFSEVRGVCEQSDVVIACLGLDAGLEGEEGDQGNQFASGDKPNINLPGRQSELLRVILDSGKPVILVLISGSALAINMAAEEAQAILLAFYPGAQGGHAVARALFGEVSPQGKLPVTFYCSDAELPAFTDYSMAGRTYRYMEQEALYPFGYGLSYTKFRFGAVSASGSEVAEEGVELTVPVENIGDMPGSETVQVYVKAERPGTPNPQLKALARVTLLPGETKTVSLRLPLSAFALCGGSGAAAAEPGEYSVYTGSSQPDRRSAELTGQQPQKLSLTVNRRVVTEP